MFLDELLIKQEESWQLPPDLYSCFNARGLYNPMQFVLRLRPDIHKELDSIESGIKTAEEVNFKSIQAFSTYFHETIHWWQHIGSTFGLVSSLAYPAQAHINNRFLLQFIKDVGPVKSILKYNSKYSTSPGRKKDVYENINYILNNWYDIEFFRWLALDPKKASGFIKTPYFESVGHSYNIAWHSVNWLLAATIDSDFDVLPDIDVWDNEFKVLSQKKVTGFYYGSDVILPPIGAREIFEGQARFSQLQYLYFASGENLDWDDFESSGMLEGVYKSAFDTYLQIIGQSWPKTPKDSSVGLFLLICDIAINPTAGFPFQIYEFASFINSVDPGMRFLMLCQAIRRNHSSLIDSIQEYNRDEYMEISEILCKEINCKTPISAAQKVCGWLSAHHGCQQLLKEDSLFEFSDVNLPVRVFLGRFFQFQQDKFRIPEYFCWPGFWSVSGHKGVIGLAEAEQLFDTHRALFIDRADGDVYVRRFNDERNGNAKNILNRFYSWNVMYELTRQWIAQEGAFNFDFFWLTSKFSHSELNDWVSNQFENTYGVAPKTFRVI